MTADVPLTAIVMAAGALACYALSLWLAHEYSRRTGWQPPDGTQNTNWAARRNVSMAIGGTAVVASAVFCVLWIDLWPARLLTLLQAVLMAAAGSSDLRRFHLPLPFTLAGLCIALVTAVATGLPAFVLMFALLWAIVIIVTHIMVTKGSMQLGDHIATLWIALASPFNGLLAVAAGDLANVVLVRLQGLRGKKVAAAGAWLIFATALAGVPPYFAWFASHAPATEQPYLPSDAVQIAAAPAIEETPAETLTTLADWASTRTALVGLVQPRSERIAAAQNAANEVREFASIATLAAPRSEVAAALGDLASALERYDVDGVRDASLRLAQARNALAPMVAAQQLLSSTEQMTKTFH